MSLVSEAIEHDLDEYFENLEYVGPGQVLDMVVRVAEKTTINYVMNKTNSNQSKAALILGVSRNTLHKKLLFYKLIED